jgi:3-methyladenine DNA glycosylase/8-oxoguanine DNA glycosylase
VRRDRGALLRLLHLGDRPVTVRAWPVGDGVRIRAEAATREVAAYGVDRMRFALALDLDLLPFRRRFHRDRVLGPLIRRRPWIRTRRHAVPFEALAWAITEQLIESQRAAAIQRRLTFRYGRPSPCGRLRDSPDAPCLAGRAPAELEACDLSAGRARAMVRVAREVAAGRVDLAHEEPAWRRLRTISGIGSWTVEKLALEGQGRVDQLPAGDLAYVKLVGRLERLGRLATEHEVRAFFTPYAPFQALAGVHMLAGRGHLLRDAPPRWVRDPARAASRW